MTIRPTRLFVTIWTIAAIAVTLLEVLAIFGALGPGSTLSDVVWELRRTRAWRAILFALWAWLGWHWFARPIAGGRPLIDWLDLYIVVAAALAGAYVVKPQ